MSEKRPIKKAQMHAGFFIPGPGDIKKDLDSRDTSTSRGVPMQLDGNFVMLKLYDKVNAKVGYELAVPLSNFAYVIFE